MPTSESLPQPERVELRGVQVDVADHAASTRTTLHPTTVVLGEERIALVGSNGQGKTTLLRAMAGLQPITTGRAYVDGVDVACHPKAIRAKVGFLFADAAAQLIMPTVLEDVELSLRRTSLNRRERREKALSLLHQAGLGHLAERSVHALSGGERQLVALTGLLAVGPTVVLADEPTSALDLVNRAAVVNELLSLPSRLIVATHDLDLALACDRVLWIHAGKVVADGAPESIVESYKAAAAGNVPWPTDISPFTRRRDEA